MNTGNRFEILNSDEEGDPGILLMNKFSGTKKFANRMPADLSKKFSHVIPSGRAKKWPVAGPGKIYVGGSTFDHGVNGGGGFDSARGAGGDGVRGKYAAGGRGISTVGRGINAGNGRFINAADGLDIDIVGGRDIYNGVGHGRGFEDDYGTVIGSYQGRNFGAGHGRDPGGVRSDNVLGGLGRDGFGSRNQYIGSGRYANGSGGRGKGVSGAHIENIIIGLGRNVLGERGEDVGGERGGNAVGRSGSNAVSGRYKYANGRRVGNIGGGEFGEDFRENRVVNNNDDYGSDYVGERNLAKESFKLKSNAQRNRNDSIGQGLDTKFAAEPDTENIVESGKKSRKSRRKPKKTVDIKDSGIQIDNSSSMLVTDAKRTRKKQKTSVEKILPVEIEKKSTEFKVKTMDEWKAMQNVRPKPTYNLRKAGEGEDERKWDKMVPLKNKNEINNVKPTVAVPTDCTQRAGRIRLLLDCNFKYTDHYRCQRGRRRTPVQAVASGNENNKVMTVPQVYDIEQFPGLY